MSENGIQFVESAWLFGSYARQDWCETSDLDVLLLTEPGAKPLQPHFLGKWLNLPKDPDISYYTRDGIAKLLDPPSLFAWHLKLEAKPLYDRSGWLKNRLATLGSYRSHLRDLIVLRALLHDVIESLDEDLGSVVFDGGMTATIARNTALILTHLEGYPDYSPFSPMALKDHGEVPFPLSYEEYFALHTCRKASDRGVVSPTMPQNELLRMVSLIGMWLQQVEAFLKRRL
jgi:hypothetical protein